MAYLWFVLFILSIAGNVLLVWYIRKLMKQFSDAIRSLSEFQVVISEYQNHLETVSNMESYYGDTTIENLLKHTKDIAKFVNDSGSLFSLVDTEEPEETINENS